MYGTMLATQYFHVFLLLPPLQGRKGKKEMVSYLYEPVTKRHSAVVCPDGTPDAVAINHATPQITLYSQDPIPGTVKGKRLNNTDTTPETPQYCHRLHLKVPRFHGYLSTLTTTLTVTLTKDTAGHGLNAGEITRKTTLQSTISDC